MNLSKQEMEQLRSLERRIQALSGSADSLYRKMIINGRSGNSSILRHVSAQLTVLSDQVKDLEKSIENRRE